MSIHGLNGSIRGIKACKIDECVALGVASLWVPHDFGGLKDHTKSAEGVIQQLLINFWIQVTNKDVGAHIKVLVMCRSFIDTYGLAIHFDHVHNFDGIVGIFFAEEFHKTIPLMLACDSVFWHVGVDHRPCLQEEFP